MKKENIKKNPVAANQDTPEQQPDIIGKTNTNVVNPIAPRVEPYGINEAVERQVATPDAYAEPATWEERYKKLEEVLHEVMHKHNVDVSQQQAYRKKAGLI